MACEVEQRGLPGLAVIGLGEGRYLSEAPTIMFRDWQVNPNSIFGEGEIARDREWMTGSALCSNHRRKANTRTDFASAGTVGLRVTSPVALKILNAAGCGRRQGSCGLQDGYRNKPSGTSFFGISQARASRF